MNDLEKYISNHIEGKKPTYEHLKQYRKNIGSESFIKLSAKGSVQLLENAVVFVSDRPNYFFLRVSYVLKNYGIKTVLLTRWGVSKYQLFFFDHIILFDKIFDLKKLKKVNSCIFYVQLWIGWNFLYLYIKQIVSQKIICNINDLSNILLTDKKHFKMIGFSEHEIQMDLDYEKQILETADLVTVPYRLNALRSFNEKISNKIGSRIIHFDSYPLKEFFYYGIRKYSSPAHLFYAGMIPYDEKTDMIFGDAKMHNPLKMFLEQQLPITIFNNPQHTMNMDEKEIKEKYHFLFSLSKKYNNFTFKTGYMPWVLKDHVMQFHYGTILYSYPDNFYINQVHYSEFLPTKLYTYIEAGLPVIIVDKLTAASELVKKHNIGMVVSQSDFNYLHQIIYDNANQYQRFIENVHNFRDKYCMEKMVGKRLKSHLIINHNISK